MNQNTRKNIKRKKRINRKMVKTMEKALETTTGNKRISLIKQLEETKIKT